jgi:acetoacetyl-CoA reductase/3-oxoacyl-[acyl-carrier protein] reductase
VAVVAGEFGFLAGSIGVIGQTSYTSAKSGLFGLTETLAREAAFQLQRQGSSTVSG